MKKLLIFMLFLLCVIKVNASIVVMDGDSGRVLYSRNPNERKLIASTTKIMTSIIALENGNLKDVYDVGNEIDNVYGSMLYIKKKEKFTLNDLLHGLMLQSGNDAAMVIANNVLDYDNFIAEMNIKAFKIGMYNTSFENPHGLNDKTKNYSTTYDMAILMKYAIKNEEFIRITTTNKYVVGNYIWYNKNKLLKEYKYLLSGKIGYTDDSGPVYVSAARKDGKTLIIVSIDEKDKFNLHKRLYNQYFSEYKRYKIIDKNNIVNSYVNFTNDYYYTKNDYYMLLSKKDIKSIRINVIFNYKSSYLEVFLDNILIHKEKLYKKSYKKRKRELKQLLSFYK